MSKRKAKGNVDSWVFLSLEGNNVGDRGAGALGRLIESPHPITKTLRKINLNECGINNYGFE